MLHLRHDLMTLGTIHTYVLVDKLSAALTLFLWSLGFLILSWV